MADFRQVGNLAFYEGWQPNYVYFSSLLNYANTMSDDHHGGWNPDMAMQIASRAVQDAMGHINPNNMTEAESVAHFKEKFTGIIKFLQQALAAEQANESAYIKRLIHDVKSNFTPEERKKITALKNLEETLEDAETKENVEFDKINTLLNVLFHGFDNTRTIIDHEEKRINQINEILEKIYQSRENQAISLKRLAGKSLDEQIAAGLRARERLKQQIFVEYTTTKKLTRKEGNRYVLFGGGTIAKEVPKTISNTFAQWVEQVLDKLCQDQKFNEQVRKRLDKNGCSSDGNFNFLKDEIQGLIIQGVIQYGLQDLTSMLNSNISEAMIADIEKKMLTDSKNNLLDMSAQYNIIGLEDDFGIKRIDSKLVKEANNIAQIETNSAEKLFATIKQLMAEEKKYLKATNKKPSSYLIQAMEKTTSVTGENNFERAENIISLIESVEHIGKEVQRARNEWEKKMRSTKNSLIEVSRNAKLSKNSKIPITITVSNGKVSIDQAALTQALKADSRISSFNLKQFNPQNLTSTLGTLKSRASKILKDDIISSLKSVQFGLEESELVDLVKRELRQINIDIKGFDLAEVITTIHFSNTSGKVVVDWTGGTKGKNDSVEILISHNKFSTKLLQTNIYKKLEAFADRPEVAKSMAGLSRMQADIERAQMNLVEEYQKAIDRAVKDMTQNNEMDKYSQMIDVMATDLEKHNSQDEKLQQAYDELKELTDNFISELKTLSKPYGVEDKDFYIQTRKECLNTIRNSFYVSTTEKTMNDYVDEFGFAGGTLGSTLDAQLTRLNDIFTSAGVPIDPTDMEWLRSAIINCFPGSVVGERNKGLIESYLGSLAAFALFDEGAVEAHLIEQFRERIVKALDQKKAQKIIHLYVVNTLYVKGSTVLQRTLDSLQGDVMANIDKIPALMRRGAGVTIINKASEDVIINRPWKNYLDGGADPKVWSIAGETVANEKVTVQILFLAGLLDIIHSINNTLAQVGV